MKTLITFFLFVASLLFVYGAAAKDPVPYPDIPNNGSNAGKGKVDVKGDVKVDSTGRDSGPTKNPTTGGKTQPTLGSPDVKIEGKKVPITGNPGMGNSH